MIVVLMAVMLLAGSLPILGLVLWVGWGKRKLGVSLIGAGMFLALLVVLMPVLDMMRMMSSMGSDEQVLACWTWNAGGDPVTVRLAESTVSTSRCDGATTWAGQAADKQLIWFDSSAPE